MFNSLRKSLSLDIAYSINSFIYILRKLPIFKDLITNDIYKSKSIKKVLKIFMIIFYGIREISIKFFYFFVIFSLSYYLFPDTMVKTFFHTYFVLTLLGLFINNKILNTSKKKYFSLILFNMDGTEYYYASLLWNQINNLVLNSICIFFFGNLLSCPIYYEIILILLSFFSRLIGESLSIYFFKKNNYIWYSNTKLYGSILLFFSLLESLPFINIYISLNIIVIITYLIVIIGILSIKYLLSIKDYKLIYKKLSQMTNIMDSKNDKDYLKQAMVSVKDKDRIIDKKKIEGKKGYDLFNTIFYERHKEILIRSAKKYSFLLIGIYIVLCYLVLTNHTYREQIGLFFLNNLGWFVVIMYFLNRGAIITQAMFFNCDHAMLNYNFYREPKVLLGLFKKRLLMLIKVNLLTGITVSTGNSIILILTGNTDIITLITTFIFMISLSVFFSVHYLVIYYLLQPFNKDLEVKKASYSIVTLVTYMVTYQMTNIIVNSVILSIVGIILSIIYIVISLRLVYNYAPKTFKLS